MIRLYHKHMKSEKFKKCQKWKIWCPWASRVPICHEQVSYVDFTTTNLCKNIKIVILEHAPFGDVFEGESSNQPNKVRVSKNHENLVFQITHFIWVWSAEVLSLILRNMFRDCFRFEKSIFQNPDFGHKHNLEYKSKSILQRWACISKIGFWYNFECFQSAKKKKKKKKKKSEKVIFFSCGKRFFGTLYYLLRVTV